MKLHLLVATLVLLTVNICLAQGRKVVARVLTPAGEPIANANVVIDGAKTVAVTNARGFFEITVLRDTTLTISHIGYSSKQIKVPEGDKFQVVLNKEIVLLETITLTAYPKKVLAIPPAQPQPDSIRKESMAHFPDGIPNFYVLAGNALYAEFKDYKGPLAIGFTIDESGKMIDIKASDSTLNKAIISDWKYMPAWIPATQRDVKVPQRFLLPIVATEPDDFYMHIVENMIIPRKAQGQGIDGQCFVSFAAKSDGTISDIKVVKGLGADYDIETAKVLSETPPDIVKSLISLTGSNKFMAIFRFELYPGQIMPELSYPSVTPEQFILGELSITARKRKKAPK